MDVNSAIGVFDSGLGGLTVLSEIHKKLPCEDLIYFGDTARVPYGSKSKATVIQYAREILHFLQQKNVKLVVVACNTATAHALDILKEESDISVMGVILPTVDAVYKQKDKISKVAVIATRSTVKSLAYEKELANKISSLEVETIACPLFVPLIEEGFLETDFTAAIIHQYLDEPFKAGYENIILGCTHYPLLKAAIQKEFPSLNLIDSSIETAESLSKLLQKEKLQTTATVNGKLELYVSDLTDNLLRLESLFLDTTITLNKVDLQ